MSNQTEEKRVSKALKHRPDPKCRHYPSAVFPGKCAACLEPLPPECSICRRYHGTEIIHECE